MARAEMIFLNEREEDLIHEQSIETLEKIGVKVHSRSVLQLLEEKGARVDYDTMIAKLPEEMVEKALETAPKEFALCARNPERDPRRGSDSLIGSNLTESYLWDVAKTQLVLPMRLHALPIDLCLT